MSLSLESQPTVLLICDSDPLLSNKTQSKKIRRPKGLQNETLTLQLYSCCVKAKDTVELNNNNNNQCNISICFLLWYFSLLFLISLLS